MSIELGGLHHVSAITGNAAQNVAFFTQVLGMRMVKKTVNQDDVSAYHLFYGDRLGNAGTEVTFFDFQGAVRNRPGVGTISTIALAVPGREALEWWIGRLDEFGVPHEEISERGGRMVLPFEDFEGGHYEFVGVENDDTVAMQGEPWEKSPVPAEYQVRGLHSMRIIVANLEPTEQVLTQVMGYRQSGNYDMLGPDGEPSPVTVYEVGPGGDGTEMHVMVRPDLPRGRAGAGGVHHVAFRTPTDEEHLAWRDRVRSAGLMVTDQIDRYYFKSIYFREPGGVLYEIATDGPGFATDEDPEHLGEKLALPPFLEPARERIEAGLKPIDTMMLEKVGA